jgi:hypothetical protein
VSCVEKPSIEVFTCDIVIRVGTTIDPHTR